VGSKANRIAGLIDGLVLGALLWRAQLRMFINSTLRSKQPGRLAGTIFGAALVIIAWSVEGLFTWSLVEAEPRVRFNIDVVQTLSLAFTAYTAVLVFSSLVFSLNALLLNPDLDMLLAAPRPVESVLAARMVVQILRLAVLSVLFTAPALLVISIAERNLLVPLFFTFLYLLYPVFVVVLISLASLFLVRVIPAGRAREVLTLFGIALALFINLLNFLFNPALRDGGFARQPGSLRGLPPIPAASSPWIPPGWAGRIGAAALGGNWLEAALWGSVLLVVSGALFAAGSILSGRLYLAGWIQAVPPRRRRSTEAKERRAIRALTQLDPVVAAILIKDWRMRTRDLAQLARFVMPVVFFLALIALRFRTVLDVAHTLGEGPAAATIGLLPAWTLLFSLSIGLGLTAVSLEGKSIWIYAASPNSVLRFVRGKCWATAAPTAVAVGLVAVATEIVVRPGWIWAITAVLLAVALAAAVTTFMVGVGGVFARFDWTDARRMMSPLAAFLGMFVFAIVTIVSILVVVIGLALASAIHFPQFTIWLAALAVCLGGAAALAALGVLSGTARLQSLELG
jgi:putative ABC exporter